MTSSTPSAISREPSSRMSRALAGTFSSTRDRRRPPSRAAGSRVHTSPLALAMSIPATFSWRSWYSSSSTSCAEILFFRWATAPPPPYA